MAFSLNSTGCCCEACGCGGGGGGSGGGAGGGEGGGAGHDVEGGGSNTTGSEYRTIFIGDTLFLRGRLSRRIRSSK